MLKLILLLCWSVVVRLKLSGSVIIWLVCLGSMKVGMFSSFVPSCEMLSMSFVSMSSCRVFSGLMYAVLSHMILVIGLGSFSIYVLFVYWLSFVWYDGVKIVS